MKILTVVHNFPPVHHAGAEVYAFSLARRLAENHEIVVFTTDHALFRRNYSRRSLSHGGLRIVEAINHRRYASFEDSYADPRMEEIFRDVLASERPDVVHFQHLLHHSIGYPAIARAAGIPSVLTLHEYWFLCGRNGQMLRADDARCDRPEPQVCARCLAGFSFGRSAKDLLALRALALLRATTGIDLAARARRVRLAARARSLAAAGDFEKRVRERERRMRAMLATVDRIVAPSRFLAAKFVAFGAPRERLVVSDYGTEVEAFRRERPPRAAGPLRIGYLGSVQRSKGVHVLLEALARLEVGTFEAELYGDIAAKPDYAQDIRRDLPASVRLAGRMPHERIPEVLARLDVLVVPSIWWENSPLVIHEAAAAGVFVVVSAAGGMAELVGNGVLGRTFEIGNSESLADVLRELSSRPEALMARRGGDPALKSMREDALFHESLYREIVQSRK